MPVERRFDGGEVRINYGRYDETPASSRRSGHPLVLLHGGSARWQASMPIIAELSKRYRIYAPDLRGHGKSGRAPGHYAVSDYAMDIAAFLEGAVKEPAVLYGHSLGGQVAIMVAALHPDLVAGLIIGDAPFDRRKLKSALERERERLLIWREKSGSEHTVEEVIEALKNMLVFAPDQAEPVHARTLFGEDSPWFPYMAENLRLLDPEMLTAVIEFDGMHEEYDCERLFPCIACPVLVIGGNPELGGSLTDEEIETATSLLPDARVVRLKTVGHSLDYPEKGPLLLAMTSFLDELAQAGSHNKAPKLGH
jgi:pimeloyl-ACP methyl ester carboxylesterase